MWTQRKHYLYVKNVILFYLLIFWVIFPLHRLEAEDLLKPNEMIADFEFLCENLIDIHPNIYANFPQETFESEKENLLRKFNEPMSVDEFYNHLVAFVARVKDAHTSVSKSEQATKSDKCLPLYLKWFGDELRIIEATGEHKEILKGAQLTSLGGFSPEQLLSELTDYAFSENQYWVKEHYTNRLTEKSMLNLITSGNWEQTVPMNFIPYGETSETQLQLSYLPSDERPKVEISKRPYFEYIYLEDINAIHFILRQFYDAQVRKNWGNEMASRYGFEQAEDFKEFLREMFTEVHNKKAEYIVVDLRENTGGNSILGFQFLRYIDTQGKEVKEFSCQEKMSKAVCYRYKMTPWGKLKAKVLGIWPENVGTLTPKVEEGLDQALNNKNSVFYMPPVDTELKFSGKLIVLISNRTFSSAMDFATILSDNDLAISIGEPTGGKPESFGDLMTIELPHSGLRVGVSRKIFNRPDSTRKDEVSLFPDHQVVTAYDDFREGIDLVMKFTKEWLKSNREAARIGIE